jgi:hypothetical protein
VRRRSRCLAQEIATLTHERRFSDRVLRDTPGRKCATFSDQRKSGPAMRRNDLAQLSGVGAVHSLHSRMVALEQGAVCRKVCPDPLI